MRYTQTLVFVGAFGVIGIALLLSTKAATPTAKLESETGTLSSQVSRITSAPASGGAAIKFSSNNVTRPTNCASAPVNCGYPGASNTGPAVGTVFKRVPEDITSGTGWSYNSGSGSIVVDWQSNGAVIDGIITSKPIFIDGKNATIKNSVISVCNQGDTDVIAIRAGNAANGYAGDHPTIINNRLSGCPGNQITQDQPGRPRSNIRDFYGEVKQAVIMNNDVSGAGNCITIESEGYIANNWCHDLGHDPHTSQGSGAGDHHSGFSNHGGAAGTNWTYNGQTHKGVEYVHNTALISNTRESNGGGLSGAITVYGDFARAQNVTADNNFVSGGAYTMYGGINNEATYGQPLNINLINNRFVCGDWVYGPFFVRASTVVTGNYCDNNLSVVN